LKIKVRGRHFDTNEVIVAESQAVLNTLTEHDFHYEFKMAEALRTGHTRGRVKVMAASRLEVTF
jgi:hypothetical protein